MIPFESTRSTERCHKEFARNHGHHDLNNVWNKPRKLITSEDYIVQSHRCLSATEDTSLRVAGHRLVRANLKPTLR